MTLADFFKLRFFCQTDIFTLVAATGKRASFGKIYRTGNLALQRFHFFSGFEIYFENSFQKRFCIRMSCRIF